MLVNTAALPRNLLDPAFLSIKIWYTRIWKNPHDKYEICLRWKIFTNFSFVFHDLILLFEFWYNTNSQRFRKKILSHKIEFYTFFLGHSTCLSVLVSIFMIGTVKLPNLEHWTYFGTPQKVYEIGSKFLILNVPV